MVRNTVSHPINTGTSERPVARECSDTKSQASGYLTGARLEDFIVEIAQDLKDLQQFYSISLSRQRIQKIGEYLVERNNEVVVKYMPPIFSSNDQQAKVDFLLIRTFMKQRSDELRAEWLRLDEIKPLLGEWCDGLIELCERRQGTVPTEGKFAGDALSAAISAIKQNISDMQSESFKWIGTKPSAYRAAQQLEDLQSHLVEWYQFYEGYDPIFTWWTCTPWKELHEALTAYISVIREHLVGIKPGQEDAIIGLPVGRDAILDALATEFIAYSPEELIKIAEKQYRFCEREAIKASQDMGMGDDWKAAQASVKAAYVEPGRQPDLVRQLAEEAINYVTEHDLVTVPEVARKFKTFMMSSEQQKTAPFFLGGESILVAYPLNTMKHTDKIMVMQGNNRHFSRSVVLHELIPGHHLQWHYMVRSKPYRATFHTPFWTEGWAFYWELILWDKGFARSPEDRLGMLFWHMHRCIRIIFSLNFHLGKWTPQQCIDALVEKVGHERATAEAEVRRSFNGDWGPLYQIGYMIGALQLYELRREMVGNGKTDEKSFHDRILRENCMPIELLRALLQNKTLDVSYKAKWRFFDLDRDSHIC